LLGEDDYAKAEFVSSIKAGRSGPAAPGYDFLMGDETSPAEILDSARTVAMDLFSPSPEEGEGRLVVVDRAEKIPAASWKAMEDYFQKPDPDACLVFLIAKSRKEWSPARRIPAPFLHEFRAPSTVALKKWISETSRRRGVSLTPAAVAALLETVGTNRFALEGELEKLSLRFGEGAEIDEERVSEIAGRSRETDFFSLGKLIFSGDAPAALRAIGGLLAHGENPVGLLAAVARHFRRLARGRAALESGGGNEEICRAAGVFWYREEFLAQVRALSPGLIPGIYRDLAAADASMKETGSVPGVVLELTALKTASAIAGKGRRGGV